MNENNDSSTNLKQESNCSTETTMQALNALNDDILSAVNIITDNESKVDNNENNNTEEEKEIISKQNNSNDDDEEEKEEQRRIIQDSTLLKDRYGFYINDEFHKSLDISPLEIKARLAKEKEREIKWERMNKKGLEYLLKNRHEKFKNRVRKGIPNDIRSIWWPRLALINDIKKNIPNLQDININNLDDRVIDEIERDIDRTFPRHYLFSAKNGNGQNSLRRILQMYASLDPICGYCQGMYVI